MDRSHLTQHVRESLEGFFCNGGREFWRIYAETPRAAVAAFKAKPDVFGALDTLYANWPKSRKREHGRISALLDLLLETESARGGENAARPE